MPSLAAMNVIFHAATSAICRYAEPLPPFYCFATLLLRFAASSPLVSFIEVGDFDIFIRH